MIKTKGDCNFCKHGTPAYLYQSGSYDAGITFEEVKLYYCPICGAKLDEDGYPTDEPARLLMPKDLEDNPDADYFGIVPAFEELREHPKRRNGWTLITQEALIEDMKLGLGRYWNKRPTPKQMEETPWE